MKEDVVRELIKRRLLNKKVTSLFSNDDEVIEDNKEALFLAIDKEQNYEKLLEYLDCAYLSTAKECVRVIVRKGMTELGYMLFKEGYEEGKEETQREIGKYKDILEKANDKYGDMLKKLDD